MLTNAGVTTTTAARKPGRGGADFLKPASCDLDSALAKGPKVPTHEVGRASILDIAILLLGLYSMSESCLKPCTKGDLSSYSLPCESGTLRAGERGSLCMIPVSIQRCSCCLDRLKALAIAPRKNGSPVTQPQDEHRLTQRKARHENRPFAFDRSHLQALYRFRALWRAPNWELGIPKGPQNMEAGAATAGACLL